MHLRFPFLLPEQRRNRRKEAPIAMLERRVYTSPTTPETKNAPTPARHLTSFATSDRGQLVFGCGQRLRCVHPWFHYTCLPPPHPMRPRLAPAKRDAAGTLACAPHPTRLITPGEPRETAMDQPLPTDQHAEIRAEVAKLCARFPGEYWRTLDRDRAYPTAFVKALTEAGYLAALIPEEYGGAGLPLFAAAAILETIHAEGCNGAACHAQMYIMGTILRHGSPKQKQDYLPKIATGELRLQAFGVTEPTSGTDTTSLRTFAKREAVQNRFIVPSTLHPKLIKSVDFTLHCEYLFPVQLLGIVFPGTHM